MAFTTTQTLDNVLLRGLTFRTPANAAISSQYTLYANGIGQTYWSNAVNPTHISSLSTAIGVGFQTISTNIGVGAQTISTTVVNVSNALHLKLSTLTSTLQLQSTQIGRLNSGLVSTTAQLLKNDAELSNANSTLVVHVNDIYNSTLAFTYSTINSISSISTYTNEISAVLSTVNQNYSTLSSFIVLGDAFTTSTLTANYISTINAGLASTIRYTNQQVSSLSTVMAYASNLSTFSSIVTQQLLSSSAGSIDYTNSTIAFAISTLYSTLYISSIQPLNSSMKGVQTDVDALQQCSTSLSSVTYRWISTFVSTSQGFQDISISTSMGKTNASLSTLTASTITLQNAVFTFSSINYTNQINQLFSTTNSQGSTIVGLQYEFSVITTSSILAGIYDSFIDLEAYTSTLIGSTIATTSLFKSSLYYSTTLQNASISRSYFNFYVSTLYASTLSTLIPSTILFTSSMVSTLYSTSYFVVISTLNSTIGATTTQIYNSTIRVVNNSTLAAYNTFVNGLNASIYTAAAYSSIYTIQSTVLHEDTFVATLDMATFRNFHIKLYNLTNGSSNYRIKYNRTGVNGLDYRRGIITIDISTLGSAYTNHNSLLQFDVYRWGLPTTVWGNVYPYISNADYTLQYEYTILNSVIYTNLLNVYPRLATSHAVITPIVRNVYWTDVNNNSSWSSRHFWRGTPIRISWSNYTYFPFQARGAPNFDPEVAIDIITEFSTIAEYGPYPLSVSTAIIYAPYTGLDFINYPAIDTIAKVYIIGQPESNVATVHFDTIVPTFDYVKVSPNQNNFIGGAELVAVTANKKYPLYAKPTSVTSVSTRTSYNNDVTYGSSNIVNGVLNRAGFRGQDIILLTTPADSQINNTFSELVDGFRINIANPYFTDILLLQQYGSVLTFTLRNATTSYTFLPTSITLVPSTTSQYNLTVPGKPANVFAINDTCYITYTYTTVPSVFTIGGYTESNCIGPNTLDDSLNPDLTAVLNLTDIGLTQSNTPLDPVSTITFYNIVPPSPLGVTVGNILEAGVRYVNLERFNSQNTETYASTFLTTSQATAQIFRF